MLIKSVNPNFQLPRRGSEAAGGFDLFMPEAGRLVRGKPASYLTPLGFQAAVPEGYVALILPRSGAGHKRGVYLNNTVGVIDSDYRGEWQVSLSVHYPAGFKWKAGDTFLQFLLLPVNSPELQLLGDDEELPETARGDGGFGSTDTAPAEPATQNGLEPSPDSAKKTNKSKGKGKSGS